MPTPYGQVPDEILARAQRRLTANKHLRYCAIDTCDQPATHSPFTSHHACETHRMLPAPPVPDPARCIYALRDAARKQDVLEEERQLTTVRITATWHPDWPQPFTTRRAA